MGLLECGVSDLLSILSPIIAILIAYIGGMEALKRVKINNQSKYKLDRLADLRKYMAAFLLRSYSEKSEHMEEVKQNLCAIITCLDSKSKKHNRLYYLIVSYLNYLNMGNNFDKIQIDEILNSARDVFSYEWESVKNM